SEQNRYGTTDAQMAEPFGKPGVPGGAYCQPSSPSITPLTFSVNCRLNTKSIALRLLRPNGSKAVLSVVGANGAPTFISACPKVAATHASQRLSSDEYSSLPAKRHFCAGSPTQMSLPSTTMASSRKRGVSFSNPITPKCVNGEKLNA